ncbi:alpha/beta fold hydrolase [Demequina lutea]|uniref:Pimeloyl-ACP methyl ester carboxylesterase n=1 Tax=Demequina lutea TaxID=431489 RepID=A0A7Z0CGW3_9MICO|nr:alpha/beta fold hydrolase [Demequina lutea]NYI40861.1 pimeloyl-ACP methyl ester carboxylesterase [Demequina lutea]
MMTNDLAVGDGNLRWYDVGPADASIIVMWHHGTPNIGEPPAPLLEASAERGIRWLGFDRPGYGDSTAADGRTVADAADLAARVADAAGVGNFVAVGHSGGGPHALACGALLGERVRAVVSIAGLAPYGADGLDFFAGMHAGGEAELRAALDGASRLEALLAATEFDPEMFTSADHEALVGEWSWFDGIAAAGVARGLEGMTADDVAYVSDWGFAVRDVAAPALVVHATDDRVVPVAHGRWNADALPNAELWVRPGGGHVSVMRSGVEVLDWIVQAMG